MASPNKLVVPVPGDGVVKVTVQMRESMRRRLALESVRRGLSLSDLVAEAFAVRPQDPINVLDSSEEGELRRVAEVATVATSASPGSK